MFWADFEKKYGLNKFATTPEEIKKVKLYEEIMEYRGYSYFLKDTKTNDSSNKYSKAMTNNSSNWNIHRYIEKKVYKSLMSTKNIKKFYLESLNK